MALYLILHFGYITGEENPVSEHSVARSWNEILLESIRNDFARPTVHARNLFHASIAMYDAWAVFDEQASTYLLGKDVGLYSNNFEGFPSANNPATAQAEAISYAMSRLLKYRFELSPGADHSLPLIDSLMLHLGYDPSNQSTDYSGGSAAALGNFIAASIIEFGLQDNSNEIMDYANAHYTPVNKELIPTHPGNADLVDPNRWQPLSFDFFIDQAGFEVPGGIPEFLSPEWGDVQPFALDADDAVLYDREGNTYRVYHDPGPPALLSDHGGGTSKEYAWNHSLVSVWSSHLDPSDSILWDISPASLGNLDIDSFPNTLAGLRKFYNLKEGGDPGRGYAANPSTGAPYQEQIVPRGDYARVLAEFWADGPDSETPPGHWYTILNYVSDHPDLEKRLKGKGEELDDLEWDVKAYFALGGAMHDAAIAAWSIKGWYDYLRPISSIRFLADQGQSTDTAALNYSPIGIPLVPGFIEVVASTDSLAGSVGEHIGKIKVKAWRGPDYIPDPRDHVGGVGWILAENWWPYQRPTFVTPPFAGYVSGHSTYSRAAAEVLT